jgi:uncharacterized protein (TIGR03067 family)
MKLVSSMLVAICLLLGADSPKPRGGSDRSHDDHGRLQGTWGMVSWKSNGRDLAVDEPELFRAIDIRWIFEGDTLTQTGNFQGFDERDQSKETFHLYPDKKPKWMDTKRNRGRKQEVNIGIYAIEGKRLKICYNPDSKSKERPTEFAAGRGSSFHLFEFERVEKRE